MAKGFVTITEFANLIGVPRGSIDYAIKRGRLTIKRTAKGHRLIHAKKGEAEWHATLNKKASDKSKKQKELLDEPYVGPPKVDQDGEITTAEAERQEKVNRARLSELKYLEQARKLIDRTEVERRAFEVARKTRDNIMTIPPRIAHELAAETDPRKVEVMLTKELARALEELGKNK